MPQGLMADLRAYCITDVSASMERTRWVGQLVQLCRSRLPCVLHCAP